MPNRYEGKVRHRPNPIGSPTQASNVIQIGEIETVDEQTLLRLRLIGTSILHEVGAVMDPQRPGPTSATAAVGRRRPRRQEEFARRSSAKRCVGPDAHHRFDRRLACSQVDEAIERPPITSDVPRVPRFRLNDSMRSPFVHF